MTLTCATFANQHYRFASLNIAAFRQLSNLRRLYLWRLREVELFESLYSRQLRIADPVLNCMPVALFTLHLQQCFEIANVTVIFFDCLLGQGNEIGRASW